MNKLEVTLATKYTVAVELDEFLKNPSVQQFGNEVESALKALLDKIDSSWAKAPGRPLLNLAGGGANLPIVTDLAKKQWRIGHGEGLLRFGPRSPRLGRQ
jgi:hypothetical protein